jgi:hypothetical protein
MSGSAHQFIGWRQTEYHSPRFLSFHCGLAQFFATIAADSVALAGATGVPSEHAARSSAIRATTANLIAASPQYPIPPGANRDDDGRVPPQSPDLSGNSTVDPNFGDCMAARRRDPACPGRAPRAALKAADPADFAGCSDPAEAE